MSTPNSPSPRRAFAALVLLSPTLLFACGSRDGTPVFAGPPAHANTAASPTGSAVPATTPSSTTSPAVPVKKPPAPVKPLSWYLSRVPQFPPAPTPQRVSLPDGGSAPFWFRVPTKQKVAFITIDDGALARRPEVIELLRRAGIPVTLFLNSPAAAGHTPYFKSLQEAGAVVENHTITHTSLRGKSYDFQKHEICGSADRLEKLFGRRPTLFRPPFGEKDAVTLRAAHDCGAKAVFYWTQTVDKGIIRYQTATKVIKPGDVLLMHFRPALMDDLLAALQAIRKAGLTPALLEDYVG